MSAPHLKTITAGSDLDELFELVTDELARRTDQARLTAYLEDRRTRAAFDRIHQHGTVATRAALEDAIAAAKAQARQEGDSSPCPI